VQLLEMAARVEETAGRIVAAEDAYKRAAELAVGDVHVWINYARFVAQLHGPVAAGKVLNEALDANPTHPALNYELARYLERVKPIDNPTVRRAYEYAVAEPVRGHLPELDFAIYLHESGDVEAANEHFRNLAAAPLPFAVKRRARKWMTEDGRERKFNVEIVYIGRSASNVAVPGFEEPVFLSAEDLPTGSRLGQRLQVNVCFNAFGPRAVPVRTEPN
jgi:hypothetical protein